MGHPLFQMHPADVGILLELDGVTDPAVWFWDDVTPGPTRRRVDRRHRRR